MNDTTAPEGVDILEGKNVMIVEDDPFLGKIIHQKLATTGAKARLVERGDTALEELRKDVPEAMLLDLRLPGMDGFQILEVMRADDKTKNVPVIIISNFDQVSDRERGAKLNADYLVKALVTPADIVNAVRKIFQDKVNNA